MARKPKRKYRKNQWVKPTYQTYLGRMYCGRAEEVLSRYPMTRYKGKVNLIFTSPPFPLNRKKKYGNLQGQKYIEWLAGFAPILTDYLTDNGSIVIELGNAWEPGRPTMSTLPMKALLSFQEKAGLNLCQEFICFNTARLPGPAQWVTVERIRIKDSFTRVWWLSPSEKPKADNRRVLTEYSDSMKALLRRGTYNSGKRPSEHNIGSSSFLVPNRGAIPPNVIIPSVEQLIPDMCEVLPIANTSSNDPYQRCCRELGIEAHPARMPKELVRFFIDFLTDPGDRVLDPFAGSNTTGLVANEKRRKWLAIEISHEYAKSSCLRFQKHRV